MAPPTVLAPITCIVDFHHARGPEVERWFGDSDASQRKQWSLLPFLALPDGSHASEEELSYFTLQNRATGTQAASSLFGVSCTRQLDAKELRNKPPDVTRSFVQKALVVIVDSPYLFDKISQRLSAVTKAWFAQKDFSDVALVESFHDSLLLLTTESIDEKDLYVGLSLRETIHEYRWQTLVLFKCALLQPKMLFYGTQCERLCLLQFTIVSLIPNLIRNLRDCADPAMNSYEETLTIPSDLKTSERASLLKYMGLPLQIFGKGALFGPYTPLQQLGILADSDTKSYIAGSTNSLLLQQKDRYSDILINLDDKSISIFDPSLRNALALSHADRRWIDFLVQSVNDTCDPRNPTIPTTHGYQGSEEFIRMQFEEYVLALLSSSKYQAHLTTTYATNPQANPAHPTHTTTGLPSDHQDIPADPSVDFSPPFMQQWLQSDNHRIFAASTSVELFDIVEPRHPCAGGLTLDDVQRRVAQQVADLHLEERFAPARAALNERLEAGQKRVSSAFVGLRDQYEMKRRAYEERRAAGAAGRVSEGSSEKGGPADTGGMSAQQRAAEMSVTAQQNLQAAGQKTSAYLSSWGIWAAEKKKKYYAQRPGSVRESEGSEGGRSDGTGGATGAKVTTVWRMSVEEDEDIRSGNVQATQMSGKRGERRYDPVD